MGQPCANDYFIMFSLYAMIEIHFSDIYTFFLKMSLLTRLHQLQQSIHQEALHANRLPAAIQLLVVSKGQSIDAIRRVFAAGYQHFGENYWQEAQKKIASLQDLPLVWHFIGQIQSNKAQSIASQMHWAHCVNTEKIALLLSQYRNPEQTPLNVCIQINLDQEEQKGGILAQEALEFAAFIQTLPHIQLRGFMAIPAPQTHPQAQYESFLRLAHLLHQCNHSLPLPLDTLSMGMSEDFHAAIRAGSTIVRLGQAIFGKRTT